MADSNITKNALAASLKNLMREKPFEKISVSDICETCGMNRKSFYYHFKDKYDLVNWIFYVDFLGKMDITSYHTGWDAVQDICNRFYEDREFYESALKIEGQNSFHDYIIDMIHPLMSYYIKDLYKDEEAKDFFITFFGDAFLASIMRWMSEDMKMKPDEFVQNLKNVSVGLAKQILRDEDEEDYEKR